LAAEPAPNASICANDLIAIGATECDQGSPGHLGSTERGTAHYIESTHTAPTWLLVVAVAAVPLTVQGLTARALLWTGDDPAC
jgi:hypothetical protein